MPAVSWPSEASFSVWIRRSCAVRSSSSDCDSSLRAFLHLLEQAHIPIAITAWSAKVCSKFDLLVAEWMHFGAAKRECTDRLAFV